MKYLTCVLAMTAFASCSQTGSRDQWFHKEATPAGRYHDAPFADSTDVRIRDLLIQIEKLEPALAGKDADRAENEANKIVRILARATQRSLSQVCEHIVWKLSTRPRDAANHETFLLDFMVRCQELILEIGGDDDAPMVENLGAYCINANRRAPFLRMLIDKATFALNRFKDAELGTYYAGLVCAILERAQWGAVRRIERVENSDAPGFRQSVVATLGRYRSRLGS